MEISTIIAMVAVTGVILYFVWPLIVMVFNVIQVVFYSAVLIVVVPIAAIIDIWKLITGRKPADGNGFEQSETFTPTHHIEYSDVDGIITERDIFIFSKSGKYIKAWCFMRNEERTFRKDRILFAVDMKTGEQIEF